MIVKLSFSAEIRNIVECYEVGLFFWIIVFLAFLSKDFMRCVSASIIFFIISIISVSKYVDSSSKAAGVKSTFAIVSYLCLCIKNKLTFLDSSSFLF